MAPVDPPSLSLNLLKVEMLLPRLILVGTFVSLFLVSSSGSITGTCGNDVTCFGLPSGCHEENQGINCDLLFKGSVTSNVVNMQIKGRVDGNVKYFAAAISDDTTMGDDAVFDCVLSTSGNVILKRSNNVRKKNEEEEDMKGIFAISTNYDGNHVTCSWKHESRISSKGRIFDLINSKYHILLAKGPFKGSSGSVKGYHGGQKTSSGRLNFKSSALITSSAPSSSDSNSYLRAHAVIMILVWLPFVSIAILLARHFKDTFGESKFCGVHIWFFFHRTMMFISVVSACVAFAFIYQHVGGISELYSYHQILGGISLAFMSLQVVTALFRCHPTSDKRGIFNWIHFLGGNISHICALAALFTSLNVTSLPPTFSFLLITFIILHVLIHLILQCKNYSSSGEDNPKIYPENMFVSESRNVFEIERDSRAKSRRNRGIKVTLLIFYIITVVSSAVALIFITIKEL